MNGPPLAASEQRTRNAMHSAALVASMAALAAGLGWLVGGPVWSFGTLVLGVASMMLSASSRPTTALRLVRARPLRRQTAPGLHVILDQLVQHARLPARPALFYIPSPIPNALSVGSLRQPVIAVTDGLLRQLSSRELRAVLAHELGHVRNGDLMVMALADTFARFTAFFGQMGIMLLLFGWCTLRLHLLPAAVLLAAAPTISTLLMLALSRQREFAADLAAVEMTGDPVALGSALRRLDRPTDLWRRLLGLPGPDANPSMLRTHPGTEERVRRLKELAPKPLGRDAQEPFVFHLPPGRVDKGQWPWESWW